MSAINKSIALPLALAAGAVLGIAGRQSESAWSPSFPTGLTDTAARRNNEMIP